MSKPTARKRRVIWCAEGKEPKFVIKDKLIAYLWLPTKAMAEKYGKPVKFSESEPSVK